MATLQKRTGWQEDPNRPGIYTRRPEGLEKHFAAMRDFKLHNTIASCAVVHTGLPQLEERLRSAWKMLRMTCPSIALNIEHSEHGTIYSYDTHDTSQWYAETFFVHTGIQGEQLYHRLGDVPRAQFHWLQYDNKHEFYIKLPHDYIDAIGLMHLMHVFLDLLSGTEGTYQFPPPGSEIAKLSPTFAVASGIMQEDHGELQEMNQKVVTYEPDVGCLVPAKDYELATGSQCVHRELGKESTVAIIKAAKRLNLTVSHVVHTAVALALLKVNPPAGKTTKYTPMLPVNLRDRLPPEFRGPNMPVATCFIMLHIFLTLPVSAVYTSEQFLSVARSFKAEYERLQTLPRLTNLYHPHADMLETMLKGSQKPMKILPFLSSLGVADRHLKSSYGKDLMVEDFSIRPDIMGGSQLLLWTFKSRMHLSINYTAGAYDDEMMEAWMDQVIKTLGSGLGLDLE